MNRLNISAFLLIFLAVVTVTQAQSFNALGLKQGARILVAAESYGTTDKNSQIQSWSPEAMLDEDKERGWCSASGASFPMSFVFELLDGYSLEKIIFDNNCQTEYPGICAKEVRIETSATTAATGYKELGIVKLDEYSRKAYPLKDTKAKWIRITILSNYGNESYTELMEIEAWGIPVAAVAKANLTGTWKTTFGNMSFKKNKNDYLYACYEYNGGEIHSVSVEGKTINFRWEEKTTNTRGWGSVTSNKDGTKLSGVWGYNNDHSSIAIWEFEKQSNTPGTCPNDDLMALKTNEPLNEKKNYLAAEDEVPVKEVKKEPEPKLAVVETKGEKPVETKVENKTASNDIVDFDPATAGKNFLFIIAINDYKYWNKLTNAKKDAQDVKEVLTSRYKFEKENVFEIYDDQATAANIFAKISEMKKHVGSNDNLLFYYSGHGYYNVDIEEGFWIPVDAKRGAETEYVPNSTLLKYIKSIPAKHIFLVADACFSGSLLSQTSRGYVENVEQYKSRWALTSGRLEFVSDGDAGVNSPFASYFIKFLRENKKTKVPVTELIQYVKVAVSNNSEQTPMGNPLKNVGDEGGEFVFYLKE